MVVEIRYYLRMDEERGEEINEEDDDGLVKFQTLRVARDDKLYRTFQPPNFGTPPALRCGWNQCQRPSFVHRLAKVASPHRRPRRPPQD